jgi:hypothetical protein
MQLAPDASADRLVPSPVFILSSIRSGSTLLRCILNSHPKICAPHELHLYQAKVDLSTWYVRLSMEAVSLDARQIEHLLWDRLLHRILAASGKQIIVEKTPGNAQVWQRLAECWPAARYLFLLRHPAQTLESALRLQPDRPAQEVVDHVLGLLDGVDQARRELAGFTVRYEDLTADPAAVSRAVCEYLHVEWEPAMLDFGRPDQGPFRFGLGDFGERIRAGRVLPARSLPASAPVPGYLADRCARWGYPVCAPDDIAR